MDFTLSKYRALLRALRDSGIRYSLRHDVDRRPQYSLRMAQIEAAMGIHSVYYFRCVKESYSRAVIRQIVALGHEIGYHYEDMSICHGDSKAAIAHFREWLAEFRKFYPVHRICMHGAPTSRFDGRELWKTYDYHQEGIDYEPYFDVDYSKVLYLTDTGRRWDGYRTSLRDKVPMQAEWSRRGWTAHTTDDVIRLISNHADEIGEVLITTHPQRWTDDMLPWLRELVAQRSKNIIKRALVYASSHRNR